MSPQPPFLEFKKIPTLDEWFDVFQISADHYVICETGHFEETLINLIIGDDNAILIDSGCGIGDVSKIVNVITKKNILLVNTHTHLDHIGGNNHFSQVAMFDHPLSRQIASQGVSNNTFKKEILADNLFYKPIPMDCDPSAIKVIPFEVSHWLIDGEKIIAGSLELEVIFTPGEAADHICLLDRMNKRLFCGDILLLGPIWTHLDGGSLQDLVKSYHRLMTYFDDFDFLMPSHNVPKLDKHLLPEALEAAEKVLSGKMSFDKITDPWGRQLKQYSFDRIQILTR